MSAVQTRAEPSSGASLRLAKSPVRDRRYLRYVRGASPDCRWRLARALLASRVARASCPWTRAKAHGRDAHATCATVNREMRPCYLPKPSFPCTFSLCFEGNESRRGAVLLRPFGGRDLPSPRLQRGRPSLRQGYGAAGKIAPLPTAQIAISPWFEERTRLGCWRRRPADAPEALGETPWAACETQALPRLVDNTLQPCQSGPYD